MVVTSPPGNTGQDKLRLVLDYIPCDVCLAIPSSEDQDTLCSICARLNRTIVERVVVHGEPAASAVSEPEPAREVEVIVREERLEEPAREPEPVAPWPAAAPAFEMPVRDMPVEQWDEQAVLPPFTVVAPPKGRMGEEWIVPGEEVIAGAGVIALSSDLTEAANDAGAGFGAWPAEEEPLSLSALEDETSPSPTTSEEGAGWEEPDEQFWEGVLEGREEPSASDPGVSTFEAAEDWLEEPAAAPARTTQETSVWETPIEEEDAVSFEVTQPRAREPEEVLDFEEVEFSPVTKAAETQMAEAEVTGEVEWETTPAEPQTAFADEAPTEVLDEEALEELPPWEEPALAAEPALEVPPAPAEGAPYAYGPYTLYHKVVETGDGETRDLYFFARAPPEDAAPSHLPDGYEVGVNERTGVPFVRRQVG